MNSIFLVSNKVILFTSWCLHVTHLFIIPTSFEPVGQVPPKECKLPMQRAHCGSCEQPIRMQVVFLFTFLNLFLYSEHLFYPKL